MFRSVLYAGVIALAVACAVFLLGAVRPCHARNLRQPGPPPLVALEGRVESIDLEHHRIRVMGVEVSVPETAVITTPTTIIRFDQLLGDILPGRDLPGFLGGTAIVTGTFEGGACLAASIEIEPSESVLNGPVTRVDGTSVEVLGRIVRLIDDPRLLGTATTEDGIPIDPAAAPLGADFACDGYYGTDGVFYAYRVTSDTAPTVGGARTLITRAVCAAGQRLEVRGVTTATDGGVRLLDADTGIELGGGRIELEAGTTLGVYRVRTGRLLACPARVRIENDDGSNAEAVVVGR